MALKPMTMADLRKLKSAKKKDVPEEDFGNIFAKPKGGPGRFVVRHGRLVPKHSINNIDDIDPKRSDLASPMLAPRFPEHRNMATGEWVTDRRKHREILKDNNLDEIGSEHVTGEKPDADMSDIKKDIKETMEQYEQGYDFNQLPSEGEDIGMGLDDHDVDVSRPDDAQYTRSTIKE